jgi:nitrite reductase/ring-hydroxylating ferredoxin subunit
MSTTCRETLIPLASLRVRLDEQDVRAGTVWKRLLEVADLAPGATTVAEAGAVKLLVCRFGSELLGYHDLCVRCWRSLRGAVLMARLGARGETVLCCPGCEAGYDVCRAGASVDDAALWLTQVPLLVKSGVAFVRVANATLEEQNWPVAAS